MRMGLKMNMIHKIIINICDVISYIYPEKIISYLRTMRKYIYGSRIKRKLYSHGKIFGAFPPMQLKGGKYIRVGEHFSAASGMILQCWDQYGDNNYDPEMCIGDNAEFGRNNYIGCINKIVIGDNLLTGGNVHITDHNHGLISSKDIGIPPIKRELFSKGAVVIGDNVWLGDNVMILPKVKIGNNVIVGANSVVTQDLPDNCVAAGAPARIVKEL